MVKKIELKKVKCSGVFLLCFGFVATVSSFHDFRGLNRERQRAPL